MAKKTIEEPKPKLNPMVLNDYFRTRTEMMASVYDTARNLNTSCHYPEVVSDVMYKEMYEREGIGTRVVKIFPEKCWQVDPVISENAEGEPTTFETAFLELENEMNLWHYCARIDELSGIGNYGVILFGFDDGGDLKDPVGGIDEDGNKEGEAKRKLLYIRTFDQTQAEIVEYNDNAESPRFGQPVMYEIDFFDPSRVTASGGARPRVQKLHVHWSRVIHIADNRKTSEVFGDPRMRPGFNRLLDIRKILGSSAEMYWKGAFPGLAFEMLDGVELTPADKTAMKEQMVDWENDLQRYITANGMKINSLAPQVVNPTEQFNVQVKALAMTYGIPLRIFTGSEAAQLASGQDEKNFNGTLAYRQNKYLSPMVIRPMVDRFIAVGVLPEPDRYVVAWPDLNEDTPDAIAARGLVMTKMMVEYVRGGAEMIMDRMDFMVKIMGLSPEEAEAIAGSVDDEMASDTDDDDEEGNADG